RFLDGCAELYYDHPGPARERHDSDAHAVDGVGVVHHRDSRPAGFRCVALGWDSAVAGSQPWYQFLCTSGSGERAGNGTQGWIASALATPVLVFWSPRGLYRHLTGHGRGLPVDLHLFA